MSQYQAPQGDAQGYGQQPGFGQNQPQQPVGGYGQASAPQGYGQASVPQGAKGGYGQASVPQGAHGGYGQASQQQSGGYGQAPPQQQPGGYAQSGGFAPSGQYPTSGNPGLFDTSFAVSSTQRTAQLAYVAIMVVAGALVLAGLFLAVAQFANVTYGGAGAVLSGLASLLVYGAIGFAILTVGRLVVDFFVQEDKKRSSS